MCAGFQRGEGISVKRRRLQRLAPKELQAGARRFGGGLGGHRAFWHGSRWRAPVERQWVKTTGQTIFGAGGRLMQMNFGGRRRGFAS